MKRTPNRRLSPSLVTGNLQCFAKIKSIKDYKPSKAEFALPELEEAAEEAATAAEKEAQAEFAWNNARNRATAAEWALHAKILGAKKQIVAQYGEDSDEVKAVGLKRKSEYKRSGGRKAKAVSIAKVA